MTEAEWAERCELEEGEIRAQLATLQRSFRALAAPLERRLADLQAMRVPGPRLVVVDPQDPEGESPGIAPRTTGRL